MNNFKKRQVTNVKYIHVDCFTLRNQDTVSHSVHNINVLFYVCSQHGDISDNNNSK